MARATLADVARLAGVSPSTASLTFSGSGPVSPATRERVLAAAAELGYTGPDPLARSLRRGASGVVGVLTHGELASSFRDPVAVRVLDGIADALGAHDLGMLLIRASSSHEGAAIARRAAMDAAIVLSPTGGENPVVTALRERGLGVVLVEGEAPANAPEVVVIGLADTSAMRTLGEAVRARGHERIALVTMAWDEDVPCGLLPEGTNDPTYPFTARRLAGVLRAGIEPAHVYVTRGSLVEEGYEAAKALLAQAPRPTAIMAFSDLLAAGVVLAARELGLSVPGDVAVTGFDGVDLPWLAPDVVESMSQPALQKGKLAARAAIALLNDESADSVELEITARPGTTLAG
ncbi:LacI family DNA-binding transcriptional regulator [Serinibacter salmoneus]|uniref:LacI family transcriptional regulator n=1 Tax=Serinibacter salmoneus TaxID=556530 RepID=A0A2A9CWU5_9MICO|nr:LacI family DNA-binding transcriptional regulator [Serinibacter salmoneus]PFG18907.1 LacI family transcriptional regulator [Serinibacter salmoneus]